MQQIITFTTSKRLELIDITRQVASTVAASKVKDGLCTVFARHATAAIIINENADPGFRQDVLSLLDKLIPEGVWEHDKVDDNGAAHLKATLLGPSQVIPVKDGGLLLGTWQGITLVELDGPRMREIVVDVRP
ncbi:MAG: YjbQ family protein [Candidatus Rokubacteria bacterium]|nr:YjbQ family protein [Candidatus Rokubacteria bacterium]